MLGDINWGEVVRKTSHLPMAFNPAHISLPLNTTALLIANNDTHQMELNPLIQVVAQAHEQLHLAMEVQQWEEDLWWWMEKGWKDWMVEKDSMIVSDKKTAVVVAKAAAVEIGKKCQKVSLGFLWLYSEF